MNSIANLTGRGILRRLEAIEQCPPLNRAKRFGRGWPWEKLNGQEIIRAQHPSLVNEMMSIYRPRTSDELVACSPGFGSGYKIDPKPQEAK